MPIGRRRSSNYSRPRAISITTRAAPQEMELEEEEEEEEENQKDTTIDLEYDFGQDEIEEETEAAPEKEVEIDTTEKEIDGVTETTTKKEVEEVTQGIPEKAEDSEPVTAGNSDQANSLGTSRSDDKESLSQVFDRESSSGTEPRSRIPGNVHTDQVTDLKESSVEVVEATAQDEEEKDPTEGNSFKTRILECTRNPGNCKFTFGK